MEKADLIDCVVEHLVKRGLPLTRENYLKLVYPLGAPDPLPDGLEEHIENELQRALVPPGYNLDGWLESRAWQRHRYRQRPKG